MFVIGGIQKTTLVDFPQKVAAIVFTQGCNFRCGYCHNSELLNFDLKPKYITEEFFEFLKARKGKLDGVVITGGEPTIQSGLYDFVKEIKLLGFAVKLDTNGTNPQIIRKLLKANLLDYVAMDIKAPIEKYEEIVGVKVNKEDILESINLIKSIGIDYEFRTTVVKSQLSFDDFEKIGQMLKGAKRYYLQKFIPSKIYNPEFLNAKTYSDKEFENICQKLQLYVDFVQYR
ncbi:anaerobic ribonucleoside-triphosphate reductase activating protein [bacterium]|nr:anaerobic ribonucleoside-triphosphate reductase activating protein [bacterium]